MTSGDRLRTHLGLFTGTGTRPIFSGRSMNVPGVPCSRGWWARSRA